jgi:tetratricopeptide (TPR) repeat protein
MSESSKRNRRLVLLVLVALGVTALVGVRYTQRQADRRAESRQAREAGMAAFQDERYIEAADLLKDYLEARPADGEAQLAYAHANLRAPDRTSERIRAGLTALQEAVRLMPENLEASHELLALRAAWQPSKALELARKIAARHPDDLVSRRMQAHLLRSMDRPAEALAAAEEVVEEHPLDLEMRVVQFQLRRETGQNPQILLAEAEALRRQFPDDPRSILLMALAADLNGDRAAALDYVEAAAKAQPPDDPDYPLSLVRFHDALGLFPRSLDLLRRFGDPQDQPELYDELLHRLFEAGEAEELVQRMDQAPAEAHEVTHLALRAIALKQAGRDREAEAALDALASRNDGGAGAAWVAVIRATSQGADAEMAALVEQTRDAIELDRNSGYLRLVLGDALVALGDADPAQAAYREAVRLRESWALPRVRLAQIALSERDAAGATRLAGDALLRQPGNAEAAILLVLGRGAQINQTDIGEARRLLNYIAAVQNAVAGEPNTAVLSVKLHAIANNPDQARQVASELLDRDPPLPRSLLLSLAQTSSAYDLGFGPRVRTVVAEHYGPSPDLTLLDAQRLARAGQVDEGLALLESGLEQASDDQQADWALARARLLEAFRAEEAADEWARLVEAYPRDAQVQATALRAASLQSRRQVLDQAIGRLRELRGESSHGWRVHRARYLLTEPNAEDTIADANTAAELLKPVLTADPNDLEARLLMALCDERAGDLESAIRQVTEARVHAPRDPRLLLQLGRLYQSAGYTANARTTVKQALAMPGLTADQRAGAAMLLASAGAEDDAVELLMALRDTDELSPRATLLLARLLDRKGRGEALGPVVEAMVEKPTPESLLFVAGYFTRAGQTREAESVLQRLSSMDLPTARRHALMGEHYATTGDIEGAIAYFRKAADVEPTHAQHWRRLVAYLIAHDRPDQALAAARTALRSLPNEPGMLTLIEREGIVMGAGTQPGLASLVESLIYDDAHRPAAEEALDLMARAQAEALPTAKVAEQLRELAEANPNFVTLHLFTAGMLASAGRVNEAAEMARATMQRYPNLPEAAAVATEALLQARRYDQALVAAMDWRGRDAARPIAAEMALARAKLGLGDYAGAVKGLEPYLPVIKRDPAAHRAAFVAYVRGLLGLGRVQEAHALLAPRVPQSDDWRRTYLRVGVEGVRGAEAVSRWLTDPVLEAPDDAIAARLEQAQALWAAALSTRDPALLEQTIARMDQIVAHPQAGGSAWYLRGMIAERAGDLATAEKAYRQTLSIDPDALPAMNNLAMVLAQQGSQLDEAVALAQKLVERRPEDANSLDTLAYTLMKAERCDEAIATINKAIRIEPDNAAWRERLSEIRTACGLDQPRQLPGLSTDPAN